MATRSRARLPRRAILVGAPVAFVLLLVAQALVAVRGEYLPRDPGYRIDVVVGPGGEEPVRLAVLGDSTAAGLGSPTVDETVAVLVAERVAAELGRPVRVMGYGVAGARTGDLVPEQLPALTAFDPDAVVAVVGSNDVTHATPPWRLRREIGELAQAVDGKADAPLVLAGIPLFGGATALAQPLRAVVGGYARVLRDSQRAAAAASGVTFVEIARDASPRFVGVPDAMSADGYHPAPTGYGFWADAIAPLVVEALTTAP